MESGSGLKSAFVRLARLAEARKLPSVEHGSHDNTPALLVAGAPFIRLLDANTAVLQCPVDQKVLLMDISPDLYFETEHYVGYDAMLVRLDRIGDEELSLRLHDAWMFKAPEPLKKI
jgi:hypothetical protein